MFLGDYQHTLDPKGRLILPAAFREQLEEGLVMTIGEDHCLRIHPTAAWDRVVADLRELVWTDRRQRAYIRMMTSSAHPEVPDRQGRITVPARLRDYAKLTKEVAVVGADRHVEVWDSARWEHYLAQEMAQFAATEQPFEQGAR